MFEDIQQPYSHGNNGAKLLLRLSTGILLLLHGVAVVQRPDILASAEPALLALNLPVQTAWLVLIGELIAPILLILGVFSRLAGGLIALQMALIMGFGFTEQVSQFSTHGGYALELQTLYLCAGLTIAGLGSGSLALMQD